MRIRDRMKVQLIKAKESEDLRILRVRIHSFTHPSIHSHILSTYYVLEAVLVAESMQ